MNSHRPGHNPAQRDQIVPRQGLLRFSSAHFLAALVLLLFIAPFIDRFEAGNLIETGLFTLVLSSAVLAISGRRRTLAWAVALVVPALLARWMNHVRPGLLPPEVFLAAVLLFMAFVTFHLFGHILHARHVNSDVLCAGIALYLVLGLLWAFAYVLVDRVEPTSFVFNAGSDSGRTMNGFVAVYFSFVTLCTVGYGDIIPASNVARMLAMLEGTAGVFYIAVLVARLMSLYTAEKTRDAYASVAAPGHTPIGDAAK